MTKFNGIRRLFQIIIALAILVMVGTAYGPNGEDTSFCAGFHCRDGPAQRMPATPVASASATAIGPGATAIVSAENNINVQNPPNMPNPVRGLPAPQNFINQYGAVDNGADLLQRGVDVAAVTVDAEVGAKIVMWLQTISARLGQGVPYSECPSDNELHPLVSESVFPRLLRDVGPMPANQFVQQMKVMGFLAIGAIGNINMAVVSGPIRADGLVGYLRMIAFTRNADGSIGQLLVDIPFSPETATATPIPPTIQPAAFNV